MMASTPGWWQRAVEWLSQCHVHKHDDVVTHEDGVLAVRCLACGRVSRGVPVVDDTRRQHAEVLKRAA